jgi:hypothetical protein
MELERAASNHRSMPEPNAPAALEIEGQDLLHTAVRLPQDLPPGPCVVLFAFSPGHQSEARSWVPALTDLATSRTASVRQVIVLPPFAKLGERIVFDQLLKSVPPEAHTATIVAFTDPDAVAKAAGAADTKSIIVTLLDDRRSIVWTGSGAHSAELESALRAKIGASPSS